MPEKILGGILSELGISGRTISLSLEHYQGKKLGAYWLDPVTGLQTFICDVTGRMQMEFRPPEREDGTDAVLVIRT